MTKSYEQFVTKMNESTEAASSGKLDNVLDRSEYRSHASDMKRRHGVSTKFYTSGSVSYHGTKAQVKKAVIDHHHSEEDAKDLHPDLFESTGIEEGKIDDLRDKQDLDKANNLGIPAGTSKPKGSQTVQKILGKRYGGSKAKADDEEGNEPTDNAGEAAKEKRGRGRPAGAKSGARTKGSDGGMSGTDDYHLSLPTKSVYY